MRLAVIGAVLVLGGVAWLGALILDMDSDHMRGTTAVAADGQLHTVPVDAGREVMLWRHEAYRAGPCEVTDPTSGEVLGQTPTDGRYRRAGGSAGDYVGAHTVTPRGDAVEVTCERARPPGTPAVWVERAPRVPYFLLRGDASGHGAYGLMIVGALVMAAGGSLSLRRNGRRERVG